MSFFELYRLVKENKLKFSKLALMDDSNEGLAMVLNKKKKNNTELHEELKNSHYISCWTQEENSVAMWLLYSSNKDAIRVKTSREKLKKYADEYCASKYHEDTKSLKAGTVISLLRTSRTDAVNYKSYSEVYNQVQKYGWESVLLGPCMIKDEAYKYENEVRSSIHLKMRNNTSKEEIDTYHQDNDLAKILNDGITKELDDNSASVIYADVDDDFIEEICFDQRTPQFQIDIYKEILCIPDDIIKSTNIFSSRINKK